MSFYRFYSRDVNEWSSAKVHAECVTSGLDERSQETKTWQLHWQSRALFQAYPECLSRDDAEFVGCFQGTVPAKLHFSSGYASHPREDIIIQ